MPKIVRFDKDEALIDWKTGKYTVRDLASKYKVSPGTIHKLVKGIWKSVIVRHEISPTSTATPNSLYIITANEFNGIYKIGVTCDISRRIADMQTGCPFALYAYRHYRVKSPPAIEAMLHAFFDKYRVNGEWFRLTELDIAYIDGALSESRVGTFG